jgi:hypothetical protein
VYFSSSLKNSTETRHLVAMLCTCTRWGGDASAAEQGGARGLCLRVAAVALHLCLAELVWDQETILPCCPDNQEYLARHLSTQPRKREARWKRQTRALKWLTRNLVIWPVTLAQCSAGPSS